MIQQWLNFSTHPMDEVKGLRALYCIIDGECQFFVYLPDVK
jgi:hypothetical protein